MKAVTDEQLIRDAGTGSREAFEALFERYRRPIWQFFRRRVADLARAEELTQDTFVALLEGAHRYQARTAFRAYLFGIAYNVLSVDRRQGRAPPLRSARL
jgi:RNA polymerase sigma-70 factor (ECF subfamily)